MNNTSGTNWAALEAMSDEDIDYSDIPPLTDTFFEQASLRIPANQAHERIPQGTLADLSGIAKRDGPAPTDGELKDEYADYLIQKYQCCRFGGMRLQKCIPRQNYTSSSPVSCKLCNRA
jgi:hypothetical protein